MLSDRNKEGQDKMKKGHGYFNLGRGKLKKTPSPCYNMRGGNDCEEYKD